MYEIYWGDVLVGFNSTLNMPSGTIKNAHREHRLVVLPDFQGLGFGTKISEFLGEHLISKGEKFFSRSTHIRLGRHRTESPLWVATSTNQVLRDKINEQNEGSTQGSKYKKLDDSRIAYSFEYVGGGYSLKHQRIVCNGECEYGLAKKLLMEIIEENSYPIIISGIASNAEITVWEKIAKEKGFRSEVLFIKRKDRYFRNGATTKGDIYCVLPTVESRLPLEELKPNIKKYITCSEDELGTYYSYEKEKDEIKIII